MIKLPSIVNLTIERLSSDGVFLLDNGIDMYIWVGGAADATVLSSLFGVSSLDGIDMTKLHLQVGR